MSKLDDFYVTLTAQKINSPDDYKSMFTPLNVEPTKEDDKKYAKCVWDTQGKVLCDAWTVNEKGGYLQGGKK